MTIAAASAVAHKLASGDYGYDQGVRIRVHPMPEDRDENPTAGHIPSDEYETQERAS